MAAAAATMGVGVGAAHAQTSVALYGIADGDVRVDHTAAGTLKSLGSGGEAATRFGLRGSEDLGRGLKAIFNFEQDFDLSDNSVPQGNITPTTSSSPVSSSGSRLFGRRAIVGISDAEWGEVRVGRDLTPFYRAWLAADPWGSGTVGSGFNYSIGSVSRFDNAVSWDSPDVLGARFAIQYRAGEATTRVPTAGGPLDGGDAISASATYTDGPLYVAGGYLQSRRAGGANLGLTKSGTLAATYDLDVVKLHALAFYTNVFNASRYFTYAGAVEVPFGAWKFVGVAARLDNRSSRDVGATAHLNDANFYSVGGTYRFSKRTDLYAVAARFVNQGAAQFVLADNSDNGLYTAGNVPPGFNPWSMQFGMRFTF